MDFVLQQHFVVGKIFEYLEFHDVYRCRLVCKTWHEEAVRWMSKSLPIDYCFVARKILDKYIDINFAKSDQKKFIKANRKMNGVDFNFNRQIEYDPPAWWFIKRSDNFINVPGSSIRRAVENFLGESIKCVPSFSLIRSLRRSSALRNVDLIHLNLFGYPAVIIKQDEIYGAFDREILSIPTNQCGYEKYASNLSFRADSCFEAFSLNRYASKHKVIITNWLDPASVKKLTFNGSDQQIKSLICFCDYKEDTKAVEKFLHDHNLLVSWARLTGESSIFFRDLKSRSFRQSMLLSIAFAGETVESSNFVFKNPADGTFRDRLLDYRDSLKFSLSENNVFGFFLLSRHNFHEGDNWNVIFKEPIEVFPEVKFIRIDSYGVRIRDEEMVTIHLVKI